MVFLSENLPSPLLHHPRIRQPQNSSGRWKILPEELSPDLGFPTLTKAKDIKANLLGQTQDAERKMRKETVE